jgi:hypothetical protein
VPHGATVYGDGQSGTPGSWNREVWWALHRAARVGAGTGRNRWRLTPPFTYGSLLVTAGGPRMPYGQSTHGRGRLTHVPHTVLFAWKAGELKGRMIAWHCGARTAYFRLMDVPASKMCPMCVFQVCQRRLASDELGS